MNTTTYSDSVAFYDTWSGNEVDAF